MSMKKILEEHLDNKKYGLSAPQKPYWKLEEHYNVTDLEQEKMAQMTSQEKRTFLENRILEDHVRRHKIFVEENQDKDLNDLKYLTGQFWFDRGESPYIHEIDNLTIDALFKSLKTDKSKVSMADWVYKHKYCVPKEQLKPVTSLVESVEAKLTVAALLSCDPLWDVTKKTWKDLRQKELSEKGDSTAGPEFDRSLYFDRPTEELIHGKAVYKLLPDEFTPPDIVIDNALKTNVFSNIDKPKPNPKPLRKGPLWIGNDQNVITKKFISDVYGKDTFPESSPSIFSRCARFIRGFGFWDK